jgi:Chromo (CHRromatin Organisation MOdifier) domain
MSRIHPMFNVIKLTPAPEDPIVGRRIIPPPLPEIIDGEEEWVVEEILDSKMMNRKLRYLVKWKDFGVEHNSWEPWDNVHAPELVADFYRTHPGAARHIRTMEFSSIPFRPTTVSRRHFSEGGRCCYNFSYLMFYGSLILSSTLPTVTRILLLTHLTSLPTLFIDTDSL